MCLDMTLWRVDDLSYEKQQMQLLDKGEGQMETKSLQEQDGNASESLLKELLVEKGTRLTK